MEEMISAGASGRAVLGRRLFLQNFCDLVLYFLLFSVCGWICESIFCSILERKVVNRGFLSGPVCPVYGFGGLVVVYILAPFREQIIPLFLLGMLATTVLEYATSYVLEKLFHTSWWDYSHLRFHLNGRVCLQFSVLFGLLSVVAVQLLYPPFFAVVNAIPAALRVWMAWCGVALLGADCALTVHSIWKLNGRLEQMRLAAAELRERFAALQEEEGATLAQRLERLQLDNTERGRGIREAIAQYQERWEQKRSAAVARFQHRRLLDAFPNMRSLRNPEQLRDAKELLKKRREKNRRSRKEKPQSGGGGK